jgi:hypothetical protein
MVINYKSTKKSNFTAVKWEWLLLKDQNGFLICPMAEQFSASIELRKHFKNLALA